RRTTTPSPSGWTGTCTACPTTPPISSAPASPTPRAERGGGAGGEPGRGDGRRHRAAAAGRRDHRGGLGVAHSRERLSSCEALARPSPPATPPGKPPPI